MTVTERIDAILHERGISRRQIAIKAKIPPSSFQSAMERGKNMTVEMLQAIASALDVSPLLLLGVDFSFNEKENPPTPSNDDAEGDKVSEDAVEQALIQAGFIKPGQDLSDEDLKFLLSVGETIKAWFGKGK